MNKIQFPVGAAIRGLGSAIPEPVRLNDFWPPAFKEKFDKLQKKDLTTIEQSTTGAKVEIDPAIAAAMAPFSDDFFRGTRKRHVLPEGMKSSDLEADAARSALDDAGVQPEEVDFLFVCSLMPDRIHPTNGPVLVDRLGMKNASAHCFDTGCASFVSHLVTASALIHSGLAKYVLSITSSTMSRFLDYDTPVSVHFGDGAGAVLFGPSTEENGLAGYWAHTDGSLHNGIVVDHVAADGKIACCMEEVIGPIVMATPDPALGKVGGLKSAHWCREACGGALEQAGWTIDEVDFFIPTQSLKWFPDSCRRALGLPAEKLVETFDEVANIAGAAISHNLLCARGKKMLKRGSKLLFYTQAVGLSRLAAAYVW